ncbi:MAG TPA: ATP-binding protein [Dehalococcoidia bacterium]|nr:ATP-binding protein [Dehalococcoidia bacterium]
MVDIYSDPIRDVKAARRLAFAFVIAAAVALLPAYWLLADISLYQLTFLLGPTTGGALIGIEIAARWEYRMRRRYAYPLRLGHELASIHDFREACQRSADLVAQWLQASAAVVAWLDDDGQALKPIAASGLPAEWPESAPHIALGARSLDEPVRWGKLLAKPSASGDPWFGGHCPQERVVYVPLVSRHRPEGVLAVAAHPRVPEARDQRLLVALGMVMGLALDNCRLYEDQRAHADHLQQINRMKSDFLTTISHELRTPLTSIKMAAEMLLEEEQALDADGPRARLVHNIVKGASRLTGLVADLVNVSRHDEFQPRLELDPVPLGDIVASAGAIIQPLVAAKHQTLSISLGDPTTTVMVDRLRFEQVLINLFSNAQRYTPESGRIEVTSRNEKGEVIIRITDSGPGVPAQDRERIFEPFFRGDRSGLGLGLAIAKSLVELHRGRIWVQDGDGQGSTFCVAVPGRRAVAAAAAAQTPAASGASRPSGRR